MTSILPFLTALEGCSLLVVFSCLARVSADERSCKALTYSTSCSALLCHSGGGLATVELSESRGEPAKLKIRLKPATVAFDRAKLGLWLVQQTESEEQKPINSYCTQLYITEHCGLSYYLPAVTDSLMAAFCLMAVMGAARERANSKIQSTNANTKLSFASVSLCSR